MKAEITIENSQALVYATSTERHQLWCLYAAESPWAYKVLRPTHEGGGVSRLFAEDRTNKVRWVQQSRGSLFEIGKLADRPVCVCVTFAEIDGIRVCFLEASSQVVDHKMIEEWVSRAMPQVRRHTANAMNWRNAWMDCKPDPLPDVPDPPPYVPPPEPPPPGPFSLPEPVALTIDGMLIAGARLHVFRSGGGLRVVILETPDGCRYYGEHPHLPDAMRILADDCQTHGGRKYSDVYGPLEPHYLTGDSAPSDALDRWVLGGRTFDARAIGGQIEVSLRGLEMFKLPDGVAERVLAEGPVRWTDARGFTFEATAARFPNGEPCTSSRVIAAPAGRHTREHDCWTSVRRATASTFVEAANLALATEPVEERK